MLLWFHARGSLWLLIVPPLLSAAAALVAADTVPVPTLDGGLRSVAALYIVLPLFPALLIHWLLMRGRTAVEWTAVRRVGLIDGLLVLTVVSLSILAAVTAALSVSDSAAWALACGRNLALYLGLALIATTRLDMATAPLLPLAVLGATALTPKAADGSSPAWAIPGAAPSSLPALLVAGAILLLAVVLLATNRAPQRA